MPHIREGRNLSLFSSRSFMASPKRLEPQRQSSRIVATAVHWGRALHGVCLLRLQHKPSLPLRSAYSHSIGGKASLQEIGSEFAFRKYTTSPPGCEIDENLYGMFVLSPCFDFDKIRRVVGTVQRHGFSIRHELVISTQNIGRSIQVFETEVGDRWVKLQI